MELLVKVIEHVSRVGAWCVGVLWERDHGCLLVQDAEEI